MFQKLVAVWNSVDKVLASAHLVVSVVVNSAIVGAIPEPYKYYVLVVFNVVQVLYALTQNPTGQ
jgi:hypothetical protein